MRCLVFSGIYTAGFAMNDWHNLEQITIKAVDQGTRFENQYIGRIEKLKLSGHHAERSEAYRCAEWHMKRCWFPQ